MSNNDLLAGKDLAKTELAKNRLPTLKDYCLKSGNSKADVRLFGDFVREGTLSAIFGISGCGKSLLAMQIAVQVATGSKGVEHFVNDSAGPKKTLIIAGEMTADDYRDRYTAETLPDNIMIKQLYDTTNTPLPIGASVADTVKAVKAIANTAFDLCETIVRGVREDGVQFVIIDNIMSCADQQLDEKEVKALARQFLLLKNLLNITILLICHPTKKVDNVLCVEQQHLFGSSTFQNHMEQITALWCSKLHPDARYLKVCKQRKRVNRYGKDSVLRVDVFATEYAGVKGVFFEPVDTVTERSLMVEGEQLCTLEKQEQAKQMQRDGKTLQEIADALKCSKGYASRLVNGKVNAR